MILSGIKTEEEEQKAENESQPKHSQWPFSQVQLLKKKKKPTTSPSRNVCAANACEFHHNSLRCRAVESMAPI